MDLVRPVASGRVKKWNKPRTRHTVLDLTAAKSFHRRNSDSLIDLSQYTRTAGRTNCHCKLICGCATAPEQLLPGSVGGNLTWQKSCNLIGHAGIPAIGNKVSLLQAFFRAYSYPCRGLSRRFTISYYTTVTSSTPVLRKRSSEIQFRLNK